MANPIFVNARFVTQPLTGVQRYAFEIARRLPNVRLIAPPGCRADYSELVQRGSFVSTSTWWPSGGAAGHAWEQCVLPRRLPPGALLWSPGGAGPLSVANQVLTIHDLAHLEHPEWYRRSFASTYRVLLPRLASRVRRIITISNHSKNRIADTLHLPPERIEVINPGVDECFRVIPQEQQKSVCHRLNIEQPFVLAVGAVSPRKNLDRLFQAWTLLDYAKRKTSLLIAGDTGPSFSPASPPGALPSGARILGRVSDEDLVALYNAALAFVYPSLYEGFGLPPLEAMACGCPVICSNNTSLPESVGDAALLVDPFSVESIAEGLRRIIEDTSLRQYLREEGLQRARLFTWDRTAAAVCDVLQRSAIG